jgi:hypothetical protein
MPWSHHRTRRPHVGYVTSKLYKVCYQRSAMGHHVRTPDRVGIDPQLRGYHVSKSYSSMACCSVISRGRVNSNIYQRGFLGSRRTFSWDGGSPSIRTSTITPDDWLTHSSRDGSGEPQMSGPGLALQPSPRLRRFHSTKIAGMREQGQADFDIRHREAP